MTTTGDDTLYGWAGEAYRPLLSTQSYGPRPQIEGVALSPLRVFSDEGGDFCEITRLHGGALAGFPHYSPAQISYSMMEPGTIKAWHIHQNQDDLWFLPTGPRLIVGLLDIRESSPTYRQSMRLPLGVGGAHLLYIPRGIAHGVANPGTRPACLIYFVNQAFDAHHPDEHRLPYDILGADFWAIQPG